MDTLCIQDLYKSYGDTQVLKGLNLAVREGEFVSLLGPSGCGKTTLLRIIAGLTSATSGRILVEGKSVGDLPPYKRNNGMVFQNYALFPHMTVAENIAFGLKMRRLGRDVIKERVRWALELVHLEKHGERYPKQLSGGQQQRIALVRALVLEPTLLLLDEPLSNLDAQLRKEMRVEIRRIQQKLKVTTIFVTHDQEEALTMSDRIAVMRNGCIEQTGTPEELYERPRTAFVAHFIGNANLVDSGKVIFSVRPDLAKLSDKPQGSGAILCKVTARLYLGCNIRYVLNGEKGGDIYTVDVSSSNETKAYSDGDEVYFCYDAGDALEVRP